jgi:hypothetical protein
MKRWITLGITAAAAGLVTASLTDGAAIAAAARQVQSVFVTNGPEDPVPVSVQGTASVQGTVGIAPDANTVRIGNTPTVLIGGTPAVALTGDPAAAAAVQAQSSCPQPCSATPFADVTLFTVPAGKRLVIEHVSGYVQLPAGAQANYSLKTSIDPSYLGGVPYSGVHLDHLLGPAAQAGSVHSVSNSLRLYADAGTTVVFHVVVETAGGSVSYVLASMSGYLVDV